MFKNVMEFVTFIGLSGVLSAKAMNLILVIWSMEEKELRDFKRSWIDIEEMYNSFSTNCDI